LATPFSTIYDQFMQFVTDYRLLELYNSSVPNFETYLEGFLIPAITDFKNCRQSLLYSSSSFSDTLTSENVKILALLMKKYWLTKEIDNITQMNLHVTDRDFKVYSESQNMREKQNRLILEKEALSQTLVDYGLDDTDMWIRWINSGVYWTP
jgi:hypothetical protein